MMMPSFASKVRPDHLDRLALVYVRQSTMIQVRDNIASTARQYDLAGRARDLGWPPERIQVVAIHQCSCALCTVNRARTTTATNEARFVLGGAVPQLYPLRV